MFNVAQVVTAIGCFWNMQQFDVKACYVYNNLTCKQWKASM